MKRLSGLKLHEEREGVGTPANKGDCVVYNTRLFLNKSDEVPLNELQAKHVHQVLRVEGGITFIDRTIVLGDRRRGARLKWV